MSKRVQQTESHALPPAALHTGDIRNGRHVVIVKAVAQPQEETGDKREFKRGRHRVWSAYGEWGGIAMSRFCIL